MRLRNVKNKQEIMDNSKILITNPKEHKGNWNKVFENNNPIHVEIGMGKGDFIINNALTFPDINFIGIERYDSVIARALEKIDYLPNLRMIRMNAYEIDEVFDKEIDTIYLNFSDPWPKKRHADRRLTSKIFLEKYDNLFKNDKIIIQKTDNMHLFEYSIVSLSENNYIIKEIYLDLHNTDQFNINTEYETRFVSVGQPIYKLVAVKKWQSTKKYFIFI